MTEAPGRSRRLRDSVFAKLLVTMLAMMAAIVLIISGFFVLFIAPTMARAVDRLAGEYAQLLASEDPNLETARPIAARFELDVRYEGPRGQWTTDDRLPTVSEANRIEADSRLHSVGRRFHVVSRPDGSSYLFAWRYHRSLHQAHTRIFFVLLCCVAVIVVIAHAVLRHAIRPIEWLHAGFARLSDGDLSVRIKRRGNDEFGELADAFNHMVTRVSQMVHERDQLLLDVSHELRSPLTRMKVALALAGDDDQKSRLMANVAEMERMVSELLEIERMREGRGLRFDDGNLIELVQQSIQSFAAREPGVVLSTAPPQLLLTYDPQKLRAVLDNLLENALKYSLPDSQPVAIAVCVGDGVVELRVDDDGPGVPESDLPHLFEPFFRVDRSRSRKTGGYGLGLCLCQRVVAAHHGSIRLENRRPRGASVIVTLPLSPPPSHLA